MRTNISSALKGLKRLQRLAVEGAEEGLAGAVKGVEDRMKATSVHGDDTGATRAAYVAYVSGPTLDGSGVVEQAAGRANDLNPGRGLAEPIGTAGGDIVVIATAATDYEHILVSVRGGKMDAITPAIVGEQGALLEAAAAGIRRKLGG